MLRGGRGDGPPRGEGGRWRCRGCFLGNLETWFRGRWPSAASGSAQWRRREAHVQHIDQDHAGDQRADVARRRPAAAVAGRRSISRVDPPCSVVARTRAAPSVSAGGLWRPSPSRRASRCRSLSTLGHDGAGGRLGSRNPGPGLNPIHVTQPDFRFWVRQIDGQDVCTWWASPPPDTIKDKLLAAFAVTRWASWSLRELALPVQATVVQVSTRPKGFSR